MSYEIIQKIDARGSYCPGPLMELVRVIKEVEVGQIIDLISADEGSKRDVPKWIQKAGHELIEIKEEDGVRHFIVKKGERRQRRKRRSNRDV